mgnify:CR=1 FL=1|jgi:Uncharacterized protein conserved in bacteria
METIQGLFGTLKPLYLLLGFFFVFLGILGAILPVMPSTVFFIVASYFFAKSSRKFHKLLLSIPYVGRQIEFWEKHKAVPRKVKSLATLFSAGGILVGALIPLIFGKFAISLIVVLLGIPMFLIVLRLRVYGD